MVLGLCVIKLTLLCDLMILFWEMDIFNPAAGYMKIVYSTVKPSEFALSLK